jgi:hypothetical protein
MSAVSLTVWDVRWEKLEEEFNVYGLMSLLIRASFPDSPNLLLNLTLCLQTHKELLLQMSPRQRKPNQCQGLRRQRCLFLP